jgi:ubiquinone/menaquinone biosynthesis C-methylase UbiE
MWYYLLFIFNSLKVARAEGIDITDAMVSRAQTLAQEKNLSNTRFRTGNALALPYVSQSFDLVTTRFSFHHFPEPLAVLKEMKRVAKKGGKVCVVDMLASTDPVKAANFNRFEVLKPFNSL